jgi:hypothetical protein
MTSLEQFLNMKRRAQDAQIIADEPQPQEQRQELRPRGPREYSNIFTWDIREESIYTCKGEVIEGHKAIIRDDTREILNVCKNSYTPSNNFLFSETVQKISDRTGYEIVQTSDFNGGRKILAWLRGEDRQTPTGPVENYLLVGNAHDSSSAFFVRNTARIVRCANQFTTQGNGAERLQAYHRTGIAQNIDLIQNSISQYRQITNSLQTMYTDFSRKGANRNDVKKFVSFLFDIPDNADAKDISTRKANQLFELGQAIERETADIGLNALGLFNAVTFYTTHMLKQQNPIFGNVFGRSSDLNSKAIEFLKEL